MKKLLLLFITIITLANASYASFPITDNNTKLTTIVAEDEEDDDNEPSLIEQVLMTILVLGALGFSLYYLIRAWRDRVRWVRILTKVILILGGVIVLLSIISIFSGGLVYNMQ